MTWIGLLLVGVGVTDLVFSIRPMRHVPEAVGASVVVVLGLLAAPEAAGQVALLLVVAGVVIAWGQAEAAARSVTTVRAWLPLVVLAGGLLLTIALSPLEGPRGGVLGAWLAGTQLPVFSGLAADRALLLLGVLLVQLSTGNVLVRLVLTVTGTFHPSRESGGAGPAYRLKGGRLLGSMERVFIVGLGLAGQLTAAAIVVAAKGLLRWPEIQASRDEDPTGTEIHQVTEYFLVGSFTSWLVALGSLALVVAP